jgi:hypothetical protein
MTKTTFTMALLALAIAGGTTSAFAQSANHSRLYMSAPLATAPVADGAGGESRQTAYGAGGSAGTHPTGANIGPNHAAMEHAN